MIRDLSLFLAGPPGRPLRALSAFALVLSLLGLAAQGAFAALPRAIPADAKKAVIGFVGPGVVEIGGKAARLGPGAQIRDTENRIVLPSHLSGKYRARVQFDNNGEVRRVWLLTPEEAAAPDPKQ